MECWASQLGGCSGGLSREHLVSKGLFDDKLITVTGFAWCRGQPQSIPLAGAVANILCKHHNELLSMADQEAISFQSAVMQFSRQLRFGNDGRLRKAPRRVELNGRLIARWLSKTYCNLMTVDRRELDKRFVAYSFGRVDTSSLSCFLHIAKGMPIKAEDGHVTVCDFSDEHGNVLWFTRIAGFVWLPATMDIEAEMTTLMIGEQLIPWRAFMKEPREISKPNEMTECSSIAFSW